MRCTPTTELPDVLAVGAWLKNAACRLVAGEARMSRVHGDLSEPDACRALEASIAALLGECDRPVAAIAHDLHPDFFSTRLALRLAAELGVPAVGVQHHHAHIAAVMAEHGLRKPVIGLALDGVGLGTDGAAWGGELLRVGEQQWERLGHLRPLGLPGADKAAREPWRMAASALHAMGRGDEIESRFGAAVGATAARGVRRMLDRSLNCPPTSSTGRWFDAAAAALGLSLTQAHEAEAAIALERSAARGLAAGREPVDLGTAQIDAHGVLDLAPLLDRLFDTPPTAVDEAAAWFHAALASALADWAAAAAHRSDIDTVCLGGGCFFNDVLTERVTRHLQARALRVLRPQRHSCGDAGLALGQAWVAARQLQPAHLPIESLSCASPFPPA
jgi:hydrogenase maturation protein HypF